MVLKYFSLLFDTWELWRFGMDARMAMPDWQEMKVNAFCKHRAGTSLGPYKSWHLLFHEVNENHP